MAEELWQRVLSEVHANEQRAPRLESFQSQLDRIASPDEQRQFRERLDRVCERVTREESDRSKRRKAPCR